MPTLSLDMLNKSDQLLDSLSVLLTNIKKNHSILSKMAEKWGELPLWIKIVSALLLFAPLLTLGIIIINPTLIITTSFCALIYTLLSLCLDNHYTSIKNEHNKFEAQIMQLGGLLRETINELEQMCEKLNTEINELKSIKHDLSLQVTQLHKEGITHKKNIEALGIVLNSFTSNLSEQTELTQTFQELIIGQSGLAECINNISNLEVRLQTDREKITALLEKYEALVAEHEKKRDALNKKTVDSAVQTHTLFSTNKTQGLEQQTEPYENCHP